MRMKPKKQNSKSKPFRLRLKDEMARLKSDLERIQNELFDNFRGFKGQGQAGEKVSEFYQEICELHKTYDSDIAHQEIRMAREGFKRAAEELLRAKDFESIEPDLAFSELQAEAVAFVKTNDPKHAHELEDFEIQQRIGLGLELKDAMSRLKISAPKLSKKIHEINSHLLAKKVQRRVEELMAEKNFLSAKQALDECQRAIGQKLARSLLRREYEKIHSGLRTG